MPAREIPLYIFGARCQAVGILQIHARALIPRWIPADLWLVPLTVPICLYPASLELECVCSYIDKKKKKKS